MKLDAGSPGGGTASPQAPSRCSRGIVRQSPFRSPTVAARVIAVTRSHRFAPYPGRWAHLGSRHRTSYSFGSLSASVITMTRKKNRPKTEKPLQVTLGEVKRSAEETFGFWNEENMREARPISIEVDRPGGSRDSKEK